MWETFYFREGVTSLVECVIKFVSLIVALNMIQSGPGVIFNDNSVNFYCRLVIALMIALMIAPMMAPMTS